MMSSKFWPTHQIEGKLELNLWPILNKLFVFRVARGWGSRRGRAGIPGIFQNDGDGDGVVGSGGKNTIPGVPVSPDLLSFRAKSLGL